METSCEHLQGLASKDFPPQKTPNACEECLSEGTVWVAARMPSVRPRRLLRLFDWQTCNQTLSRDAASGHASGAARGLDLVLCS